MLNNLEIQKIMIFDLDFNYSLNPVQVSQRMNAAKVIYHSQNSKKYSWLILLNLGKKTILVNLA